MLLQVASVVTISFLYPLIVSTLTLEILLPIDVVLMDLGMKHMVAIMSTFIWKDANFLLDYASFWAPQNKSLVNYVARFAGKFDVR